MTDRATAGPSGTAEWKERQLRAGFPRPLHLRILSSATADGTDIIRPPIVRYYVPAAPLIALDGTGNPVLSLTLILSQPPAPDGGTLAPLIQSGVLTADWTLALPDDARTELAADDGVEYRPLYARDLRLDLRADGKPIAGATAQASGADARAGLRAVLDAAQSLDVLAALDSAPSRLTIHATLTYRAVAPDQTVHVSGSWAAISDALRARSNANETLDFASLRATFADLLKDGTVAASTPLPDGDEMEIVSPDVDVLFALVLPLMSVVVTRVTLDLALDDMRNRYQMRGRPHPMFRLDVQKTLTGGTQRIVEVAVSLDQALGGVLAARDRDPFVHLVAPAEGDTSGGLHSVPRRVRTARVSRDAPSEGDDGPLQVMAMGGKFVSPVLAARPASAARPAMRALLVSDALRDDGIQTGSGGKHLAMMGVMVARPEIFRPIHTDDDPTGDVQNLSAGIPIVTSPAAGVWPDAVTPRTYWYAPEFEVVQPAENDDPDHSPFLFTYTVLNGLSATGMPLMEGTVRFTMRRTIPSEAMQTLASLGNPDAHPLPTAGLTVAFTLPFRDETHGVRMQDFPATVSQSADGTITATVQLLDQWVQLCYGALAYPGFQPQPASVHVSYAYTAYQPYRSGVWNVVYGTKTAFTPLIYAQTEVKPGMDRAYINATNATYHFAAGEVRFQQESPMVAVATRDAPVEAIAIAHRAAPVSVAAFHMNTPATSFIATTAAVSPLRAVATSVIASPTLEASALVSQWVKMPHYAQRTFVRDVRAAALLPCTTAGTFYRRTTNEGTVSIGCQDAFRLSETTYRQYEEMPELRDDHYRVFRSLQQPGRFLVLPAVYAITRFDAAEDDGKAYRPVIFLYANVIDPVTVANNPCVLLVTLQPDIAPYLRRQLRDRLTAHARDPVLEYPTDIECQTTGTLNVGSPVSAPPQVVRMWDSFQITVTTNMSDALLLQSMLKNSGIHGLATFRLPDSTELTSQLSLDLRAITGPWESGPLATTVAAGMATITNRIDRPVNIADVAVYTGTEAPTLVAVEQTLAPGASLTAPVTATAAGDVFTQYTVVPGTAADLTEIESFVEDIHTNVVFIDLIRYANHDLARLDIQARLKDSTTAYPVTVSEAQPVGSVDFMLPLTSYLRDRAMQFQVTKTLTSGQSVVTPWLDWNLSTQGNVVSLTWEMIA